MTAYDPPRDIFNGKIFFAKNISRHIFLYVLNSYVNFSTHTHTRIHNNFTLGVGYTPEYLATQLFHFSVVPDYPPTQLFCSGMEPCYCIVLWD